MQVLELSLKYLFDDSIHTIERRVRILRNHKYVIIVPTHFDQNMQDFIRRAAVKSGMSRSSLTIILETEAVFFYHQCLQARKENDGNPVCVGKKHLVAVLGDEISTVTVNKKGDDGLSDEVLRINKGPWGMHSVLNEFKAFLIEIIGEDRMQTFTSEHRNDFDELIENFSKKFKRFDREQDDVIRLSIPLSLIEIIEETMASFQEAIHLSRYADKVSFHKNFLISWNRKEFAEFGKTLIKREIELIKAVLSDYMEDVDTILLAGVLSESVNVQNAVRESFSTKHVVVLDSDAELRGAVYLGHFLSTKI